MKMATSDDNLLVHVIGVTSHDADRHIVESLKDFGPVARIQRTRDTRQLDGDTVIVEFESGANVMPLLPMVVSNANNPGIKWQVTHPPTSNLVTEQISSPFVSSDSSDSENDCNSDNSTTPLVCRRKKTVEDECLQSLPTKMTPKQNETGAYKKNRKMLHSQEMPELSNDVINPPEIQRVIVEHVIKSQPSNSKWMRTFSGRIPKPPGEADYETWSLHAELMFNDDSLSVDVQRRKILESLLPPASDVVRQLGTSAHPKIYVQLLDSAYGLVEDGEEVFAKFLNTNQNAGEKASDYLQRLQSLLYTAVKRGGAKEANADRHLLKQFKRGCWDHSLVLQLELKNEIPPNFAELLLQIRTEEDRRASKNDRMQRHLGATETKPFMNVHCVPETSSFDNNVSLLQSYITETESLRSQVAQIQMQLHRQKHKQEKENESKANTASNSPSTTLVEVQAHRVRPQNALTTRPQPKAWFCFKCGEDGHIARNCDKPVNKALVDQKYAELKIKQDDWKAKQSLNWTRFQ
ncbi:zinc finger CCHC domain-containing protein 12-like [Corythoichthys intestinalis]|uniref:zinc finger CCHC domain-containing protein 12-like n=1 Tax=Corythoichthys intestinalis TaxID=161448 RepID=UPI0025A55503|nr:zinc finger CCHC domain-containing protein 12-like [Corythoichthys intestinalis]XP_057685181.1 zinc finger CCHC domain-containing protein 12-like [Corythoichthys intestinalis]